MHFHLLFETTRTCLTTLSVASFGHACQQSEGVALSGEEPAVARHSYCRIHLLAGNIL
jgi:hypothetical protein